MVSGTVFWGKFAKCWAHQRVSSSCNRPTGSTGPVGAFECDGDSNFRFLAPARRPRTSGGGGGRPPRIFLVFLVFGRRLAGPEQVAGAAPAVRHLFPFCVSACLGLAFRSAILSASSALFEERNSNKKK